MKQQDIWVPDFYRGTPLFSQIEYLCWHFSQNDSWPDLAEYQALLNAYNEIITTGSGAPVRFVPQSGKPCSWEDGYEPRIYQQGEIQTRLKNWHDFFQVIMWTAYPRTKVALNDVHFRHIKNRSSVDAKSTRGPIENALTIFDECGAVIVTRDSCFADLIKSFRWKELFWERRDILADHMKCFLFGHAIYEKALHPYLGLTAHAIIFQVKDGFFAADEKSQIHHLDQMLAEFIYQEVIQSPQDLNPFPLLGMPGWWENNQAAFYDNEDYFRPGRRHGGI